MKRLSDVTALGLDEGVAHAATDDEVVNFVKQVLNHSEFAGNL